MPIRNLSKIFEPKSIAIIGPCLAPDSLGRTCLKNLKSAGFKAPVYIVTDETQTREYGESSEIRVHCPRSLFPSVAALPIVFPSVADLPETPDLAIVSSPAKSVVSVVRECGEKGIRAVLILSWSGVVSTGFRETGTRDAHAIEARVRLEAQKFDGMRILGPNSLGVIVPRHRLNASCSVTESPRDGTVAFISQSSRLCNAVLDWAAKERVGFSHVVSLGNTLDVSIADLIDYFSTCYWTHSLVLYVESIAEARDFMSAARAFARQKPIIVYKAGRFEETALVSSSYTGAMANVDLVYEAAFRRAGCVRVFEMNDMFDCAELLAKHDPLLAKHDPPSGPRLAIVTNAGGPSVMATDELLAGKGQLAQFGAETLEALNLVLSPDAPVRTNPIDVMGGASPDQLGKVVELVLRDENVDAVLVIFAPQAGRCSEEAARAVIRASKVSTKPVLTSWMGGKAVEDSILLLNEASIPTYSTPEPAVRAFMYLVKYGRTKEVLYETPREIPGEFSHEHDRGKLRSVFACVADHGEGCVLSEKASKTLVDAYGIPVAKPIVARTVDDAKWHAKNIGFPVAMKIDLSPHITRKTDIGGVVLNIVDEDGVEAAFEQILRAAKEHRPEAHIIGVTVQKMVSDPLGLQLIVGAKRDPVFGVVILVGTGGIGADLYKDQAIELPPLNERLARRMLESLNICPLLKGHYRGRPPVNIDRLVDILVRLSYLVADFHEIQELDVNPLLVTPEEVIALDARIIVNPELIGTIQRPYSHLAIRPYPEEYTREVNLRDSTPVLLRPIKPEDEPMWHEMIARCSDQSKMFRFFVVFKDTTHDMASRYCFIDYDREMAIVAEIKCGSAKKLVGVGRLVADADHTNAEYAVIVEDNFQGQGLGALLTNYCLEICNRWGIASVVAETSPNNRRMLDLFSHRGFELVRTMSSDIVLCHKDLVEQSDEAMAT